MTRRTRILLFALSAVALLTLPDPATLTADQAVRKEGKFWLCETRHYLVKTDVSADFAKNLGDVMESCYTAYSKYARGKPRFAEKSTVIVFKRQKDFLKQVREVGPNTAGCYSPATKELASFLESQGEDGVYEVLRHEGFHQFFDKYVGTNAPAWINEGLAGYFEHCIKEGNEYKYRIVLKMDVDLLQRAFKGDKVNFISPRELMLMELPEWNRNVEARFDKARLQYLEARLLVQFLMSKKEYTRMMDNYLLACGKGLGLEQGIRVAFGAKLDSLTKAWMEYMKNMKVSVPESCTLNLQYLATLLQMFSKYEKIDSPAALHAAVKNNKTIKWYIRAIGGGPDDKITQDDWDVVEKWFHCPKEKRKLEGCSYEFVKSESKCGFPDIICRNHAPVALRAVIMPGEEEGKNRTVVREEPLKKQ